MTLFYHKNCVNSQILLRKICFIAELSKLAAVLLSPLKMMMGEGDNAMQGLVALSPSYSIDCQALNQLKVVCFQERI